MIGVGDSRPRDGFSTALLGIAVTEANIRTEPRALTQATQVQIGQTRVNLYPQFAASPGHLALSIRF
ncbi:MAG: hypothetical protein EA349_02295 [Halomonadaceae bacterium]|nr:MAG: hypothetical protein EA349_02295 [Halomonadaceae bacterium]